MTHAMRGRRGARLLGVSIALQALAAATGADAAQAQEARRCALDFPNTPSTRFTRQQAPDGTANLFLGGGVRAVCVGQDITLVSDSAEYYESRNLLYLIGNVRYREPRVRVDANRMTYFQAEERLLAEGSVNAVMPSGTTMRGPTADYYRAVRSIRPRARLYAPGRPVVTLVETDSVRSRAEPTRIVANVITMDGDSLVYASGGVEMTRTDVEARADSAFLDGGREYARLMRRPSIVGRQRRPFTLKGETIDLFSRDRQLARVLSMRSADVTSEDLRLTSDTIDMRLSASAANNTIERVHVWGRSRAQAVSPEQDIVADSLDVQMPGQRLSVVYALRDALAHTRPDSTKIRGSAERDWLRGDTIVARFDTAQPPRAGPPPRPTGASRDSTPRPRIRELVSTGSARAYYQVPNPEGPDTPPGVNYVRGRQITVSFVDNAVSRVTVVDRAAGVYIEAVADSAAAPRAPGAAAPQVPPPPPRP